MEVLLVINTLHWKWILKTKMAETFHKQTWTTTVLSPAFCHCLQLLAMQTITKQTLPSKMMSIFKSNTPMYLTIIIGCWTKDSGSQDTGSQFLGGTAYISIGLPLYPMKTHFFRCTEATWVNSRVKTGKGSLFVCVCYMSVIRVKDLIYKEFLFSMKELS